MTNTTTRFDRVRGQEGFSLIELMVVVVIIGILATAAVLNFKGKDDQARVAIVKSDLKVVIDAAEMFKLDHGRYPDTLEELMNPPDTGTGMKYLKNQPVDPWTQAPYEFELRDEGPVAWSFGADQSDGGDGFNADIYSNDLSGTGNQY